MSPELWWQLGEATLATIYMVFVSGFLAACLGLPIAVTLAITRPGQFCEHPWLFRTTTVMVNVGRSIPFIILMVAIIPFTRLIVGTSIGTEAAIVPLTVAAIPFFARMVEGKLRAVDGGLIEAAQAMGCSTWQIIIKVLIPESLPGILNGLTILFVSLTEFSAMAGAVGGSGLGNMAIQYGYYQFNVGVMLVAIVVLVSMVLSIQWAGDRLVNRFSHKARGAL